MKYFLSILLVFCCLGVFSQEEADPTFYLKDAFRVKKLKPGEVFRVSMDTLYLMNRFTFQLYHDNYVRFRDSKNEMGHGLDFFEGHAIESDQYFDNLKDEMNRHLQLDSLRFMKLQSELDLANGSLEKANKALENAGMEVETLKHDLGKQRWTSAYRKAGWGLGGLCAGIILMIIFN